MDWLRKVLSSSPKKPPKLTLGRNDPCWCGSDKKYKACHLQADRMEDSRKAAACNRYS